MIFNTLAVIENTVEGGGTPIDLDAEITTQDAIIATQSTAVSQIRTALEGKAGGGPTKTTRTIYLDWSGDEEPICGIRYVSNGSIVELGSRFWGPCPDVIEAEGGVVEIYEPSDQSYYSDNFILFSGVLMATQDGETIHLVSTGEQ